MHGRGGGCPETPSSSRHPTSLAPDLSGGELSAVQDIPLPHKGSIILKGYADAGEYAGCGGVGQSDQEIFQGLWTNHVGIRGGVGWFDFAPATAPLPLAPICTTPLPPPAILQRNRCFCLVGGAW